ncbi:lamin tail domain-containing protein [Leifsonia sp. YIM 134122]|uniref:Lamin tail domain-containing protein n=1 Tax=Leifsonia stereocauli TaxID=3134136 RepID=A0ABU9W0I9_9MICO
MTHEARPFRIIATGFATVLAGAVITVLVAAMGSTSVEAHGAQARLEGIGSAAAGSTSNRSPSLQPRTDDLVVGGSVVINELAAGGPASDSDSFFELRNVGTSAVDLSGWGVYRCSAQGLRANAGRAETDLDGITLAPGEIFTAARVGAHLDGAPVDAQFTQPFAALGFGLYLEDAAGDRVDSVGVFPNQPWPTTSECSNGANLPNSLAAALGESWQRVAATGVVTDDFQRARATPGAQNAPDAPNELNDSEGTTVPDAAARSIVINELAAAGPASRSDDFVELRNEGEATLDLAGWQLFRCTVSGRLTASSRQIVLPEDTRVAPGGLLTIANEDYVPAEGEASVALRYSTSFSDSSFGALLTTPDGTRVDGVTVSPHPDSACQDGDAKLPAELDYRAGESWQRIADTGGLLADFVIAPRTPGTANATEEESVFRGPFDYPQRASVAISEFATDPSTEGMPAGSVQRNFVELANYGDESVDLSGWSIARCEADGLRAREDQARIADGTILHPGQTWLAAADGTPLAATADARYATAFDFLGSGVWVADAAGERVDSVGVYHANEMDHSTERPSPCTKGLSLITFEPDRLLTETYQRTRFTGVDADDFVTAPATPGELDEHQWVDPTVADVASLSSAAIAAEPEAETVPEPLTAENADGRSVEVLAAYAGLSVAGGLTTRVGDAERPLDARETTELTAADDAYDFPYLRLVLDAATLAPGDAITWAGSTVGRNELQLSVWNEASASWRLLDAGVASATADADGTLTLTGTPTADEVIDGGVEVLVQNGQRTERTLSTGVTGDFEHPDDYDLAISHVTDTQYLTEAYPDVYTGLVSWIALNAQARKIAFATHTGDLVQNWVDPDQNERRARREFARASAIQGILDTAGVPNSVLPGNHDNKRGVSNELFNEYFPPERYSATATYGGSIAPGDNSANFNTFEHDGARFLMLSLPYAFGERELAWAEQVVASHPDHNVIISTHEHVTPKTAEIGAGRSTGSRWVSRGGDLWDRIVAPNRNVLLVLSGHFHGLGQITTENAGGIAGHTVVELVADYQEFRTHTGERATGFQRLLQLDLDGGAIAVDTFSLRLGAHASYPYDYEQFVPDNGSTVSGSNARPWRIVADGLQDRYTSIDDEFQVPMTFQFPKLVQTASITAAPTG